MCALCTSTATAAASVTQQNQLSISRRRHGHHRNFFSRSRHCKNQSKTNGGIQTINFNFFEFLHGRRNDRHGAGRRHAKRHYERLLNVTNGADHAKTKLLWQMALSSEQKKRFELVTWLNRRRCVDTYSKLINWPHQKNENLTCLHQNKYQPVLKRFYIIKKFNKFQRFNAVTN